MSIAIEKPEDKMPCDKTVPKFNFNLLNYLSARIYAEISEDFAGHFNILL